MWYIIIVGVTLVIVICSLIAVAVTANAFSIAYAVLAPIFLTLFCALTLGVLDLIIRFLPKKVWNFDKKPFAVSKGEVKFYEKLGIKKWKDRVVPELGASAGFSKKNLQSTTAEYLSRFLQETCEGEALHFSGGVLSFAFLALFPISHWLFALPILFVNLILNLLPCMIQRYNRYRLKIVYDFKMRHEREHASMGNAASSRLQLLGGAGQGGVNAINMEDKN